MKEKAVKVKQYVNMLVYLEQTMAQRCKQLPFLNMIECCQVYYLLFVCLSFYFLAMVVSVYFQSESVCSSGIFRPFLIIEPNHIYGL